jgi:hypothetical protein
MQAGEIQGIPKTKALVEAYLVRAFGDIRKHRAFSSQ